MALATLKTPEAAAALLEAGVLEDSTGKSAGIQHGILRRDAEWDRPHRRALRFLLRPIARHRKDSEAGSQAGLAGASDDEFEVSGSSDNFESSSSAASLRADPQQRPHEAAAQQQSDQQAEQPSTSGLQRGPLRGLWRGVLGLVAHACKGVVRQMRPRVSQQVVAGCSVARLLG